MKRLTTRAPGILRVLHVIPSISSARGGPSEALRQMVEACRGRNVSIEVATTDDDGPGRRLSTELAESRIDGAVIHMFPRSYQTYTISVSLSRWLMREAHGYDVLHVHALFSCSSTVAMLAAHLANVPYIVRPLGTLSPYGIRRRRPFAKRCSLALVERPLLNHAAAVHCTSLQEKAEVEAIGILAPTKVIPLAARIAPRERSGPPSLARPTLLFLSRLDPKKNVEGLIDAFALIAPRFLNLRLNIAGDGDDHYVRQLKARADAAIEVGRVKWLGDVRGERKEHLLLDATIFVLPSLAENFGIAVAEALGAGLPCVVGEGVAIAVEVEAAGAGIAVGPDAPSIARAIELLLTDPERLQRMGSEARSLAQREYSVDSLGTRLRMLYESLSPRECA